MQHWQGLPCALAQPRITLTASVPPPTMSRIRFDGMPWDELMSGNRFKPLASVFSMSSFPQNTAHWTSTWLLQNWYIREHKGFCYFTCMKLMVSVLWHCWLGSRKGIWPVKNWVVGWSAGMVICLEQGADLHMAQLIPLLLTASCFSKIQIGFTFLVLAHPG